MELKTGRIVYAKQGRDAQALIPLLKILKRCRPKLLVVAMDISPGNMLAVGKVLPGVEVA